MLVNRKQSMAQVGMELAKMVAPIEITLGDGSVVTCDSLKEALQKLKDKEMKESRRLERLSDVVTPRRASAAVDRDGNWVR